MAMNSEPVHATSHQHAFKSALSKVAAAGRRLRRRRQKRARPAWLHEWVYRQPVVVSAAEPVQVAPQPDPVKLAVLAMDGLGRASMRASFTGVEVKVAVPDDATAAIFRAALSETVRNRPADRLVRVVVD
ncbi:MAG TPA: hypothetical protein VFQ90_00075 [Stellaceae bacterium]|jgi:hypothetical protein|nr:hypothetical protein [Stellaceae bacterium]